MCIAPQNLSAHADPQQCSGFSMLEIMMTLSIAGILLSMAAPSLIDFYRNQALTTQANDAVATLSYVRSEAIRRNTPITLCRTESETSESCAQSTDTWIHWLARNRSQIVLRGSNNESKATQQTASFTKLVFGADGLARVRGRPAQGHYLQISAHEKSRCINIGAGSRNTIKTAKGDCQ